MDRPDPGSAPALIKPVTGFPPVRAFGCDAGSVSTAVLDRRFTPAV